MKSTFVVRFIFVCFLLLAGLALAQILARQLRFAQPAEAAPSVELTISAAASLKNVMNEIARDYKQVRPGTKLRFNFASSGTLQHQIEQGAPIDLFISAADKNIDQLAARKLIDVKTRHVLAQNRLVLIVPQSSKLALRSFSDVAAPPVKLVAIGGPDVPAGLRAQEVFTHLGVWSRVLNKAVRGKDVRAVLAQVEMGNMEAGVVYRTDALSSRKVRIVAEAAPSMHQPIRYPLAVVAGSRHRAQARAFADYLKSATVKATLCKFNFIAR